MITVTSTVYTYSMLSTYVQYSTYSMYSTYDRCTYDTYDIADTVSHTTVLYYTHTYTHTYDTHTHIKVFQ